MLFYRMQFKLFRYMENVNFSSVNTITVAAQSVSNRVLTPAEQFALVCLNNNTCLEGFIRGQRFDPDVEPHFLENADLKIVMLYNRLYKLSEKMVKILTLRFCNLVF